MAKRKWRNWYFLKDSDDIDAIYPTIEKPIGYKITQKSDW